MSQNCGTLSLFFYCPLYHHLGGNHFQCLVCVRVNEMKCFDSKPTSFVLRNQYNCSNLNLLPNSLRVPFVVLCRARIRFVLYTNSFFCAELPAAPEIEWDYLRSGKTRSSIKWWAENCHKRSIQYRTIADCWRDCNLGEVAESRGLLQFLLMPAPLISFFN